MKRTLASLLLILLIQCALVIAVYWPGAQQRESTLEAMAPFDLDRVTELYVGDEFDNETALRKIRERWFLPELEDLPADTVMVDTLLDAIADSAHNWPIADSVAARQRFRVASYHYRRRISLFGGDEELGTLLLGTSPGFGKIYARNQSQVNIFSIRFNAHDAPGVSGAWLDRKLLQTRTPVGITADAYSLRLEGERWLSGIGKQPDERERITATLAAAHRKWAHGVTVIWYPLKDRAAHLRWKDKLRRLGIPKFLTVEHWLYDADQPGIYNGAGLFIVNPPFAFTQALPPLLAALRAALAPDGHRGEITADWLTN